MIGLAGTLGRRVMTADGQHVGRLRDLSVEYGDAHPQVRHLVAGPDRVIPWAAVESVDDDRIVVRPAPREGRPAPVDGQEPDRSLDLLLNRDVMDTQIVDVAGRRVSRVGDILMTHHSDGRLEVVATEIGARPVLRRIAPGTRWFTDLGTTVDWADLHLTSDRGHEVQLASDAAAMHRLGADGLAHLLSELNVDDAADVVGAVGAAKAAAALARSERSAAARILLALEPARARAVLGELTGPARERLTEAVRRRSARNGRRFSRFDGWRRHRPADHVRPPDGAR